MTDEEIDRKIQMYEDRAEKHFKHARELFELSAILEEHGVNTINDLPYEVRLKYNLLF